MNEFPSYLIYLKFHMFRFSSQCHLPSFRHNPIFHIISNQHHRFIICLATPSYTHSVDQLTAAAAVADNVQLTFHRRLSPPEQRSQQTASVPRRRTLGSDREVPTSNSSNSSSSTEWEREGRRRKMLLPRDEGIVSSCIYVYV